MRQILFPDLYVSLPRYTILLLTKDVGGVSVVAEAPPIARWTIGMKTRTVLEYYLKQEKVRIFRLQKAKT